MDMIQTKPLEEIIKKLPPEDQKVVEGVARLLLERGVFSLKRNKARQLKLNWRGGLKDLRDKYTSVELQHQILKEWDKDVSG